MSVCIGAYGSRYQSIRDLIPPALACVAVIERGGMRGVCPTLADHTSRSPLALRARTPLIPPLSTPATQATPNQPN